MNSHSTFCLYFSAQIIVWENFYSAKIKIMEKRHAKLLLMRCISWFLCDYVMRSLHNRSTAPRNFANTHSRFPTFYDYSRNIKANIIKTCRTPGDNDPLPAAQKEPHLLSDVVLFSLHLAPLAGIEPATNP